MSKTKVGVRMKPAILQPLPSRDCLDIVNGKKKILIRKRVPKLSAPYKIYFYCTETSDALCMPHLNDPKWQIHSWGFSASKSFKLRQNADYDWVNGKIFGECLCTGYHTYTAEFTKENTCYQDIRQKYWDGEDEDFCSFIITSNEEYDPNNCELLKDACTTFDLVRSYIGTTFHDKEFYGLVLDNIKIYSEPKLVQDFRRYCNRYPKGCGGSCRENCIHLTPLKSGIARPCWVEDLEGEYDLEAETKD